MNLLATCYGHVHLPDNANMKCTSFAGVKCCITVSFSTLAVVLSGGSQSRCKVLAG